MLNSSRAHNLIPGNTQVNTERSTWTKREIKRWSKRVREKVQDR